MTRIKNMAEAMMEEICSAKEYAEEYLFLKSRGESMWANRYKEMSTEELKHANYIHERLVNEIEDLKKVYTPPSEMMDKWEKDHKEYVEKAAWVKQMLLM